MVKTRASRFVGAVCRFLTICFGALSCLGLGAAEELVGEIVGFNVTDCLAGSDTIVAVPFHRPAVFRGTLSGNPLIGNGTAIVFDENSDAFEAEQWLTEPHFLRFTGNSPRAGWYFRITGNGDHSIVIDLSGDDLAGVVAGQAFEIIPYWTLDGLFPEGNETVHLSTGNLVTGRGTEVRLFDRDTVGANLAPARKFFLTDEGWHEVTAGFSTAGDVVIPPGTSFVIRHPNGVSDTRFVAHQVVESGDHAYAVRMDPETATDHYFGSMRPVPVKLKDLGLGIPVFQESVSNDPEGRADELHVYDNTVAAVNREPSAIYFRVGGQWFRDDDGFPPADDDELDAGAGFVIRKFPFGGPATFLWLNTPHY